jgi:DNA mismatch repair ATPase MutS
MDPLPLIAIVLKLSISIVQTINASSRQLDSQSRVLKNISDETSALCTILRTVEKLVNKSDGDSFTDDASQNEAFQALLDGCRCTLKEIENHISEIQHDVKRGLLKTVHLQITYPAKMKTLSTLRDQLENYKTTILIALQMHMLLVYPKSSSIPGVGS